MRNNFSTHVAFVPRAFPFGSPISLASVGICVILHIDFEISSVVNRFHSGLQARCCSIELTKMDKRSARQQTFIRCRWGQSCSVTEDNRLIEIGITCQMILSSQVDLICTFFQGLKMNVSNFAIEPGGRRLTRRIRGSWKLKYSWRMD